MSESTKVIVGLPLASVAVALPVALGAVLAGQSNVTLPGTVIAGAVLSRTVMSWVQLELFPQGSVAVQRREMVLVLPQLFVTESTKVIVTELHVSVEVATPVTFVVVTAGYSNVRLTGQLMTGAVVSRTAMVCVQLELLPHRSVAVQRREIV